MAILVTVIIPIFNNSEDILNAINSIKKQTHKNWELIVVDDASTDNLENKIKNQLNDKIKLIKNDINRGSYYSINKGITVSKGEYITVLGSDDTFHEKKLEKQVKELNNKNYEAVGCYFSRSGATSKYADSMIMFRRSLIKKIGYFDCVRFGGDSEFYYRIYSVLGSNRIKIIPEVLYYAKKRQGSLTQHEISKGGSPSRKQYVKNYKKWHSKKNCNMKFPLDQRMFSCDSTMKSINYIKNKKVEFTKLNDGYFLLKPLQDNSTPGVKINQTVLPNIYYHIKVKGKCNAESNCRLYIKDHGKDDYIFNDKFRLEEDEKLLIYRIKFVSNKTTIGILFENPKLDDWCKIQYIDLIKSS